MPKTAPTWLFGTVEETEILAMLEQMEADPLYNTQSRYVADTEKYPDNVITFSQIHMGHLKKLPSVNPHQYISNLKLMTKVRI